MIDERDPKYKENGDTEGLSQRQLLLEVRRDVKDLKEADADHAKEGHSQYPTWPQMLGMLATLVAVSVAFARWAG